ncbi:MAG: hypothetical protein RLZZ450_4246 [Pseudomonadota bacterium]
MDRPNVRVRGKSLMSSVLFVVLIGVARIEKARRLPADVLRRSMRHVVGPLVRRARSQTNWLLVLLACAPACDSALEPHRAGAVVEDASGKNRKQDSGRDAGADLATAADNDAGCSDIAIAETGEFKAHLRSQPGGKVRLVHQ